MSPMSRVAQFLNRRPSRTLRGGVVWLSFPWCETVVPGNCPGTPLSRMGGMTTTRHHPCAAPKFVALELALELIMSLRALQAQIRRRDGNLANQLVKAASSVAANVAEGNRRTGKDRLHLFASPQEAPTKPARIYESPKPGATSPARRSRPHSSSPIASSPSCTNSATEPDTSSPVRQRSGPSAQVRLGEASGWVPGN